jgi:hypothetical protein
MIKASTDDRVQTTRKTSEGLEAKDSSLSSVGACCFGRKVDSVRGATPQCWVLNPGYYAPAALATASYAKDTGLIILHVSPD